MLCAVIGVGALSCGGAAPPPIAGVPDRVDFNFHVKPLLSDRCFKCHGPDDRQRKGGLRLDVQASALATLESGHRAVVPGSVSKSELVRRITSTDPKVMMPAPDSHLALDEIEKATLIRWIEQGAEWKPHWAFIAPKTPAMPAVTTAGWARGEIDRFVLAALEAKGWTPAPEASRETWLRRASFDLTGLPPTPAEIDAFLADARPDAYDRAVDRLLASPAYGERMAADWLDIARYADSHGYQDDGMREMWPWRDWVITAFNRNLPFDDFITWQLAGDLLPNPTQEQRIATGFNRNHMQSQEGGIVAEEYPDRVRRRSRQHAGPGLPRAERRVRPLPRSQVRPGLAARVLPALRLLQQRQRSRPDSLLGRAEPDGDRHVAGGRRQADGAGRADHRARGGGRPCRHAL